jgi:hypothetical protein
MTWLPLAPRGRSSLSGCTRGWRRISSLLMVWTKTGRTPARTRTTLSRSSRHTRSLWFSSVTTTGTLLKFPPATPVRVNTYKKHKGGPWSRPGSRTDTPGPNHIAGKDLMLRDGGHNSFIVCFRAAGNWRRTSQTASRSRPSCDSGRSRWTPALRSATGAHRRH